MENILVTVVVPIYNVEPYLCKCIDSILEQSYSNLEIILVDDGSLDKSGEICDTYANKDNRIKVIHKSNGGLSSARNSGIEIATGEYILFVDSDDYTHPLMVEKLVKTAEKYKVSIVCCDYTSEKLPEDEEEIIEIIDRDKAICKLLNDDGYKCFAWNKIYKLTLFKDVKYPIGKLFEDISTTYKVFKKASKIVYLKNTLYFYRIREGSISRYKFSHRDRDLLEAINTVFQDACSSRISNGELIMGYMSYYLHYIKKGIIARSDLSDEYSELCKIVRKNWYNIFTQKNISFGKRIQLAIIGFNPKIYKYLCILIYNK